MLCSHYLFCVLFGISTNNAGVLMVMSHPERLYKKPNHFLSTPFIVTYRAAAKARSICKIYWSHTGLLDNHSDCQMFFDDSEAVAGRANSRAQSIQETNFQKSRFSKSVPAVFSHSVTVLALLSFHCAWACSESSSSALQQRQGATKAFPRDRLRLPSHRSPWVEPSYNLTHCCASPRAFWKPLIII